ncbi:MAG: hypothetical protein AB7P12_10845 [Alphaproteobacteria bacterium]
MSPTADPAATVHRWPVRALVGDYLRAGVGLAVCFPPLLVVEWTLPVVGILGGLSGLFAWLGLRAAARQRAVVRVDESGIARGRRLLPWSDMTRVTARRFGVRRKDGGIVEMTLRGPRVRIALDSEITDFVTLAGRIFVNARGNGITFDTRTRDAFAALGLRESR